MKGTTGQATSTRRQEDTTSTSKTSLEAANSKELEIDEYTRSVLRAVDLDSRAADLMPKAVELALAHEYRPSEDPLHLVIMASATLLAETHFSVLESLDLVSRAAIGRLERFCWPQLSISGGEELESTEPSLDDIVEAMFKLLLTVYHKPSIPGAKEIRKEIDKTRNLVKDKGNTASASVKAILNQFSLEPQCSQLAEHLVAVSWTLLALFKSDSTLPLTPLVECWIFESYYDSESSSADSTHREEKSLGPASSSRRSSTVRERSARIRKASLIRKDLINLRIIIKCLVAWEAAAKQGVTDKEVRELYLAREAGNLSTAELDELEQNVLETIDKQGSMYTMLEGYKGSKGFTHICMLIQRLRQLDGVRVRPSSCADTDFSLAKRRRVLLFGNFGLKLDATVCESSLFE